MIKSMIKNWAWMDEPLDNLAQNNHLDISYLVVQALLSIQLLKIKEYGV